MNDLAKNLGIDVTDQKFKEQVGLAAQGRFGEAGVDWTTGQDFIEPDAVWNYITNIFQTPIDPADLPKIMGDALSGKGNTPLAQFWRDGVLQTAEMALYIARFQILRDGAYNLLGIDEEARNAIDSILDISMLAYGGFQWLKGAKAAGKGARASTEQLAGTGGRYADDLAVKVEKEVIKNTKNNPFEVNLEDYDSIGFRYDGIGEYINKGVKVGTKTGHFYPLHVTPTDIINTYEILKKNEVTRRILKVAGVNTAGWGLLYGITNYYQNKNNPANNKKRKNYTGGSDAGRR